MIGALSALCAVGAGAFGAHGLRARLAPEALAVFEVAARYQMYHALALLLVACAAARWRSRALTVSAACFVAGTLLFSGSLYALALTGVRGLGLVTPFGGLAFMAGWAALAWGAWRGAGSTAPPAGESP